MLNSLWVLHINCFASTSHLHFFCFLSQGFSLFVILGCNGESDKEQSCKSCGTCYRCYVSCFKVWNLSVAKSIIVFFHFMNYESYTILQLPFFYTASAFGAKIVPPKRILKMLPELFDHQDQNVRASSKGLTLELCRWIGKDPVKSILFEKMRDTMVCKIDYLSSDFFVFSYVWKS